MKGMMSKKVLDFVKSPLFSGPALSFASSSLAFKSFTMSFFIGGSVFLVNFLIWLIVELILRYRNKKDAEVFQAYTVCDTPEN